LPKGLLAFFPFLPPSSALLRSDCPSVRSCSHVSLPQWDLSQTYRL